MKAKEKEKIKMKQTTTKTSCLFSLNQCYEAEEHYKHPKYFVEMSCE